MVGLKNLASKISVSPTAVILPAALIFIDASYLLLLTIIAAVVHELGHFAALRISNGTVSRIKFGILGVSIEYGGSLSYGGEVFTALAGCGANAALAMLSAIAGRLFGFTPAYHLAGLCAVLCVFNLLPAYPLDGGRAVYNALAYFFGLDIAQRVIFALRCAVLFTLSTAGLWLVLEPAHNPTLLICAVIVALWRE